MVSKAIPSILVLGESGVGKSHYLAQVYLRLLNDAAPRMRLRSLPKSLDAVNEITERLVEGCSGTHTPAGKVTELSLELGVEGIGDIDLVVPDYAGEHVRKILTNRSVTSDWVRRVSKSIGWLLFLRIDDKTVPTTPFSAGTAGDLKCGQMMAARRERQVSWSRGAEVVELLQILLHSRGKQQLSRRTSDPVIGTILTCWDELGVDAGREPKQVLAHHLPLVSDFLTANWADSARFVLGLSSTGVHLNPSVPNKEWRARGPENEGFTILSDGSQTDDLTVPLMSILFASVA